MAVLRREAPRWAAAAVLLDDPAVLEAARGHARDRFEQGLEAAEIATEFRLLRQEIGRALRLQVEDRTPTRDVVAAELLVHDALDGAITLALDALTRRVEEVRAEFLATTVHDVQQPLTTVKANFQLLRRGLERGGDATKLVEVAARGEAEADRMARLLATLADTARWPWAAWRCSPRPWTWGCWRARPSGGSTRRRPPACASTCRRKGRQPACGTRRCWSGCSPTCSPTP